MVGFRDSSTLESRGPGERSTLEILRGPTFLNGHSFWSVIAIAAFALMPFSEYLPHSKIRNALTDATFWMSGAVTHYFPWNTAPWHERSLTLVGAICLLSALLFALRPSLIRPIIWGSLTLSIVTAAYYSGVKMNKPRMAELMPSVLIAMALLGYICPCELSGRTVAVASSIWMMFVCVVNEPMPSGNGYAPISAYTSPSAL